MSFIDRPPSRKATWLMLGIFPLILAGALLVVAGLAAYTSGYSGYGVFVDAWLLSVTLVFFGKALESLCNVYDWIRERRSHEAFHG